MASVGDIALSGVINILSALAFLLAFAVLRLQPMNDRVYFPKWYLKGIRSSPRHSGNFVSKFVNLDLKTYLRFLNWMPEALKMPEPELINHAGLDSVVYIRIYLLGLKIFVPLTVLAFCVLVPVNWTGQSLQNIKDLQYSNIDKFSISNIATGSERFDKKEPQKVSFTMYLLKRMLPLKMFTPIPSLLLMLLVTLEPTLVQDISTFDAPKSVEDIMRVVMAVAAQSTPR